MKYIESLKYLSKEPISQFFQYWIYQHHSKFVIKHPVCEGSIDKIYKYQEKINNIYSYFLNNIDNYVQEPSKYLNYMQDSIRLRFSDDSLLTLYADEFNGLNINFDNLNYIFTGNEHKDCLKKFLENGTLENCIPSHIQNAKFLYSDNFIFQVREKCKQFGLAGIIVPKILQTEDFILNLEKNIQYLSNNMLIQSQAYGNLDTIFLIDDKDYSGNTIDLYQNIEKITLSDSKIILKINTDAFKYSNFINMPSEKLLLFTENVLKKKKYKI